MPRASSSPTIPATVRFAPDDFEWVKQHGRALGGFNDAVRELVRDARTCYDLPAHITETLIADAGDRPLRDYVVELLVRRYNELAREEARREDAA